jgi:hypothetical protein
MSEIPWCHRNGGHLEYVFESLYLKHDYETYIHVPFGIARKATGITALRCARRTVLWGFPIDKYSG